MIELRHISKTFRIPMRKAGTKAALRAFFQREYKEVRALEDISLHIKRGEIVGYIGPNGAGKSTTIKIMSGILKADTGECRVNGLDPYQNRKQHAQQIGVVFGQRSQLWWDIPVIDSFELLKDMYQIPQSDYETRLNELVVLLELEQIIQMPTRQLSLGQRMRCEIVASLLHNPAVLFLDEPTIGLDAQSKITVRSFIKEINRRHQTTIILTTHDMQDIESLANRIILIGKGSILFDGSMEDLRQQYDFNKVIKLRFSEGTLRSHPLYEVLDLNGTQATVRGLGQISDVIQEISSQLKIEDISISGESIETILLTMYQDLEI